MSRRKKHKVTSRPDGATVTGVSGGSFPCPYCGGEISVVNRPRALMHSMPPCEKYIQEDMLVFLRNARVFVFGPQPDDDEWPIVPPGRRGDN